jgi:hypothetical protein
MLISELEEDILIETYMPEMSTICHHSVDSYTDYLLSHMACFPLLPTHSFIDR